MAFVSASSDASRVHTFVCSSVCRHPQPPVLVNIRHLHYNLPSPAELNVAGGGQRRGLPSRPLGCPPSQRKVPKFSGVLYLSLACHWPSSFLSFIPRKADFPPAIWGWEGQGRQTHAEGKLRTPPDPAPQPWDTVARGGGLLSWERLFLTGSKWPENSTFSTPVGPGGSPRSPAGLSSVLANQLQTRRGPCCEPASPCLMGSWGEDRASRLRAGCPGCTCPPPSCSLTLLGPRGKQAPPRAWEH